MVKSYLTTSSVQSQVSGNSLRTLTDFVPLPFCTLGVSVSLSITATSSASITGSGPAFLINGAIGPNPEEGSERVIDVYMPETE